MNGDVCSVRFAMVERYGSWPLNVYGS